MHYCIESAGIVKEEKKASKQLLSHNVQEGESMLKVGECLVSQPSIRLSARGAKD